MFSEVEITTKFELHTFLTLLDVPWSSLGPAVQRLILTDAFWNQPKAQPAIEESSELSIVAQLVALRSIRWTGVHWHNIPASFKSIFFKLPFVSLEMHRFYFARASDLAQLLLSLPVSTQTVSMSTVTCDLLDSITGLVPRHFHWGELDTPSLAGSRSVWEWMLAHELTWKVKSLRIEALIEHSDNAHQDALLVSRVLSFAGSSIDHIFLKLPNPSSARKINSISVLLSGFDIFVTENLLHYPLINLSCCTTVRSIHIESIRLQYSAGDDTTNRLGRLTRDVLSIIPPHEIEEVAVTFKIEHFSEEKILAEIAQFDWASFAAFLLQSFDRLKRVHICIGGYYITVRGDISEYADSVREHGFALLAERGIILSFGQLPYNVGPICIETQLR